MMRDSATTTSGPGRFFTVRGPVCKHLASSLKEFRRNPTALERSRAKTYEIALERVLLLAARFHKRRAVVYRLAGAKRAELFEKQAAQRALHRLTKIGADPV